MSAVSIKARWQPVLLWLAALATVAAASGMLVTRPRHTAAAPPAVFKIDLPPPNLVRPVSVEEALHENAARSFARREDTPALPFRFAGDEATRTRATECLAQAVYYEAAAEGIDGERAVAQIVLNRVRHRGYPSSICGVVYQGSAGVACQFTFTCDGSLARAPIVAPWRQAHAVAVEAIDGRVFQPVGHATHYHADYVLPYWADSLDKSVQIGHHIFYRLKGALGTPEAYSQRYAGHEPSPFPIVQMKIIEPSPQAFEVPEAGPGIQPKPPRESSRVRPQLLADLSAGVIIADTAEQSPPTRQRAPADSSARKCASKIQEMRLRPLSATDLRSGSPRDCN